MVLSCRCRVWYLFVVGRRPPAATLTDTLFPDTTLVRSRVEVAQQFRPLFGGVGDASVIGGGQIGRGARLGPPDAAAQLVQLGKAEPVGAVDDQRVGARNIEARFDDRRRYQHVIFAEIGSASCRERVCQDV